MDFRSACDSTRQRNRGTHLTGKRNGWRCLLLSSVLALGLVHPGRAAHAESVASGRHGIVATVHPLATEAAVQAMSQGGNAIDAVVAAALTLGVVDGHNSGLGGGCFLLLRLADGTFVAIDGRERAPAAATADMFSPGGHADGKLSQSGALAVGVPGALAAYDYALRQYGKLPLATHLRVAAGLAERGFNLDRTYAQRLAATAPELQRFESARAIFLRADGTPRTAGDVLMQPDLARTYRSVADQGVAWFYNGPFAESAAQWMQTNGGRLTADDFRQYQIQRREPIRTTYHGYEIVGFPPPSSGGVHVAQILNILEPLNLRKLKPGSADFIHLVAEAMKLAFADRAYWLGDPDFVSVPRGLVGKEYAARLARRIDRKHATAVTGHDTPGEATTDVFGKHTTHFSTADADGNWAACTATINTSFGSKVVVPGTGVLLNNQMDDFSIQAGVPNAFGLVGGQANAVAPGKRPLSSMSPTLALKGGHPVLSLGAAGGPTIISQTVLTLIYVIDFEMPLERALAEARFHHQWQPNELRIERKVDAKVRRELEERGHVLRVVDSLGAAQAVSFDPRAGLFTGCADPRGEGQAGGD